MLEGLYFEYPLAALLILLFIACARYCPMRRLSLYYPNVNRFAGDAMRHSRLVKVLKWLGIVMLVVAIMSPVRDKSVEVEPTEGYDIALVLDASKSMSADGFDFAAPERNRFDVVKDIVNDFIKQRTDDNMGVVVFGAYSFVASPLTYDQHILARVVDQLYIGMAGPFTALYEALAQSVNLLKGSKAASRIAILLTDGHNQVPGGGKISMEIAIELAKKAGIRVYTIGVGMPDEYNTAVLKSIAEETGGEAFGAQNAAQLKTVYETIDRLEKSQIERERFAFKKYYFHFPLFIALFALLGYLFARHAGRNA